MNAIIASLAFFLIVALLCVVAQQLEIGTDGAPTATRPNLVKMIIGRLRNGCYVDALINGHLVAMLVDTGATMSQIDMLLATELGLKGHPELLGFSSNGNGGKKYDYLSPITVNLGGIDREICIKVGPNVFNVLGLDILTAFNADVMLAAGYLSLNPGSSSSSSSSPNFAVRNFYQMLSTRKLSKVDMVSFSELSIPLLGYEALKTADKGYLVVNVGYFRPPAQIYYPLNLSTTGAGTDTATL